MANAHQNFQVGIKAFITKGDTLLMVKGTHIDPHWELPGGRIDLGEEILPAEQILKREILEELGADIRIKIDKPIAAWSRQLADSQQWVYLIGLNCIFISGKVQLSHEHSDYRWVTRDQSYALALAEGYDRALDQFWKNR